MSKITKNQMILIILVIIIPLAFLCLYLMFKSQVVTKETKDKSNLPQINISGSDTKEINKILSDLYSDYTKDGKSKFDYTYTEYKNVLSVLIKIEDYLEETDEYVTKYLCYNIDKKTKKILSTEELIEKMNYDFDNVVEQVDEQLRSYYDDARSKGYFDDTCDYNCFLDKHNSKFILENVAFVIEDKQLVAYLNLGINSNIEDSEYFKNLKDQYRIFIKR